MPTRPTPTRPTPTRTSARSGSGSARSGPPGKRKPRGSTRRRTTSRRTTRRRTTAPSARTRLLSFGVALGVGLVVALVSAIVLASSGAMARIGDAVSQAGSAAGTSSVSCPAAKPVQVGTVLVPAGPIDGYCQDRLINAAHIINAARAQGIGTRTQAIGVMTAMGESSLVNIDHGDAAGPDSRGLFQQRANGAWGSYTDRMTPYIAATDFFDKLIRLPNWKTLTPTIAAHEVQVNADPNHYAKYWPAAVAVVTALQ